MKAASLIMCLLLLVGCAMPTTRVQTVDDRPSISVHGAPRGAVLIVDGLSMGRADQYDGAPQILRLESGTHEIQIVKDDTVVFAERIFLGSAHKKINVR
jgi:hypothetical protein